MPLSGKARQAGETGIMILLLSKRKKGLKKPLILISQAFIKIRMPASTFASRFCLNENIFH
jgi:hypothetical protein